jgi:hypothetical protein
MGQKKLTALVVEPSNCTNSPPGFLSPIAGLPFAIAVSGDRKAVLGLSGTNTGMSGQRESGKLAAQVPKGQEGCACQIM